MNHTMIAEKKVLWVLGHRIEPLKATGQYDAVRITTAPGVPGPPPHHHDTYAEMFIVISGSAQFLVDGEIRRLGPGDSVDLAQGVVHTFANAGEDELVMVNIHSPKGFMAFFEEVGFNVEDQDALENSVSEATIAKVMSLAPEKDMHIQPAHGHL